MASKTQYLRLNMVLSSKLLANLTGFSRQTICRWKKMGKIPKKMTLQEYFEGVESGKMLQKKKNE